MGYVTGYIKRHNASVEKHGYEEAEYCKDANKTFRHIQMFNFDSSIHYLEYTHKVFIANGAEIRSRNAIIKEVPNYKGL